MAGLRFEWDLRKSRANQRKHGVSFEEAQTVFLDDHALLIDDPDSSDDEDRFVLLGLSSTLRALDSDVRFPSMTTAESRSE